MPGHLLLESQPLRDTRLEPIGEMRPCQGAELQALRALAAPGRQQAITAASTGLHVVAERSVDGAQLGFFALAPVPTGMQLPSWARTAATWQLDALFVDPRARRTGVGRQLFFDAMARMLKAGGDALVLETDAPGIDIVRGWIDPATRLEMQPMPAGDAQRLVFQTPFVAVQHLAPNLEVDLRYTTSNNFVGRRIVGYDGAQAYLCRSAALALAKAQRAAQTHGLRLKVFDAYRPVRATRDFLAWSQNFNEPGLRSQYFPTLTKPELFAQGYIAQRSGHSRGATLDCTLVAQDPTGFGSASIDGGLEMGTPFDHFDADSHTAALDADTRSAKHRALLLDIMATARFENYPKEWWHFTLQDEPFPNHYFDFHP